ncbi:MAG: flagellar biosynthetic protein FliO [Sedimenticola sp.]|nr:flagellar biosynthetic protein FliO [Sedimenticola sp.]
MRAIGILSGLVLFASSGGSLAEAEKPAAPMLGASPLGGGVLLETAGGLLLILGLIFALGWGVRRFGRLPMATKADLSVLGGVSLGPRERAVLLKVGDTKLLVGVAPGRVQTLHVLERGTSELPPEAPFAGQLESEMAEKKP